MLIVLLVVTVTLPALAPPPPEPPKAAPIVAPPLTAPETLNPPEPPPPPTLWAKMPCASFASRDLALTVDGDVAARAAARGGAAETQWSRGHSSSRPGDAETAVPAAAPHALGQDAVGMVPVVWICPLW